MATNPTIRQISRSRLFEVLKSKDLVDLFEDLLYGVGTTLPAGIDEATGAADAASATATSVQENLNTHVGDTADAHDASAISNVPAGGVTATDVQGAINELDAAVSTAGAVRYSRSFLLMGA